MAEKAKELIHATRYLWGGAVVLATIFGTGWNASRAFSQQAGLPIQVSHNTQRIDSLRADVDTLRAAQRRTDAAVQQMLCLMLAERESRSWQGCVR